MRHLAIWITLLALLAGANASAQIKFFGGQPPASATSPAPTTEPSMSDLSPQDQEIVRLLKQSVQDEVKQLKSDRPRQREYAQQSLLAIHQQLLMPVQTARKTNLSAREYNTIMADWIMEIRLGQIGSDMGMEQMAKVRKLRLVRPDIMNALLSEDSRRLMIGIYALQQWNDPQQLAEPLLIRALRNSNLEAIQIVISLVNQDRYTSQAMCDLMLDIYEGKVVSRPVAPTSPYAYTLSPENLRQQIRPALGKFKDKRLPPILLGALTERNNRYAYQSSMIISGLVKNNAVGAIPWLLEAMDQDNAPVYSETTFNNQKVTMATVDSFIVAIIRLSGQKEDDYKLKTISYGGPWSQFGFESAQTRKEAMDKIKKWWADNRNKAPYSNAPKIVPQSPNPANPRDGQPGARSGMLLKD